MAEAARLGFPITEQLEEIVWRVIPPDVVPDEILGNGFAIVLIEWASEHIGIFPRVDFNQDADLVDINVDGRRVATIRRPRLGGKTIIDWHTERST